jgi:UTP--glucose-1-phosphate uridylyltransferase
MLADRGREAIAAGQVASVVLAGGMATRFGGAVKAAVEAVEGHNFLELKLRDTHRAAEEAGGRIPVYLMTSFATDADVTQLAQGLQHSDRCPVETFPQFISLRLTPQGEIFTDDRGHPSPYAPGHGDLTFALRRAGLLDRFLAAGGRVLYMSNVDNVTATMDPAVIGAHLESSAAVTAEVAPKEPGDKGGAPARVEDRPQIVEAFRFPVHFDQDTIPVFNTNSFVLDAEAVNRDFPLTWFAVTKKVDGREAVQFERLVGELTAFLPANFLRVERYGPDARFQPVKDPDELESRRNEILEALKTRGVL